MWGKFGVDGYFDSLEYYYVSGDVVINFVIMLVVLYLILGMDVGVMRGGNIMYCGIFKYCVV